MNNYIKKLLLSIGLILVSLLSNLVWAQNVNLNSHVSTTGGPTASSDIYIRWYTVSNPTPLASETAGANNFVGESLSSAISTTPINVTATTTATNYYVFYYSVSGNCLSTNYGKVTVITNSCPTTTVSLSSITTSTAPSGSVLQWHTVSSNFVQSGAGQTLVSSPSAVGAGTYYPVFYDSSSNCYSPVGTPVIVSITTCACYENPSTQATAVPSKHGITLLKRAGKHVGSETGNDWPMLRQSGHTVLESNKKPFVITRIAKADLGNITNPVVGMMVFDTTDKCLKIYTGDPTGVNGWKCFTTPGCPN